MDDQRQLASRLLHSAAMKIHRGGLVFSLIILVATATPSLGLPVPIRPPTGTDIGWYEPWTPPPPPPVVIPSGFGIASRRLQSAPSPLSDVVLRWADYSEQDASTLVERQLEGGTWTAIYMFNTALEGDVSYTDSHLQPDTRYCYRVTVFSGAGHQARTSPHCVVTQKRNDFPVWRVQLRVRVASVTDAGTDRPFGVALNGGLDDIPKGNWTGINYGIDDFEKGSDFTYDLTQQGITTLRDITKLSFGTSYVDDAVCLRQIQLLVNGAVAFDRSFSTCKWVGGAKHPLSLTIPLTELRANTRFANFVQPTPSVVVPPAEIESRIESTIGSLLWESTDVKWGEISGRAVEVSRQADRAIHVDLDLEGIADNFPNPEVDVDFDVEVGFVQTGGGWELRLDPTNLNVNVDFSWWAEELSGLLDPICAPAVAIAEGRDPLLDCISELEDYIEGEVEAGFSPQSQRVKVSLPAGCNIPDVFVSSDGSLRFSCAG
jgi:hypothetical protein